MDHNTLMTNVYWMFQGPFPRDGKRREALARKAMQMLVKDIADEAFKDGLGPFARKILKLAGIPVTR